MCTQRTAIVISAGHIVQSASVPAIHFTAVSSKLNVGAHGVVGVAIGPLHQKYVWHEA